MSARNDGGPAFPVEMSWDDQGRMHQGAQTGIATAWHAGMTLRDYFAANVMQALIAHYGAYSEDSDFVGSDENVMDVTATSEYAYIQADAMIAERAK